MRTQFAHVSVQQAIAAFSRITPAQPKRIPLVEASGLRLAEDVVVRRGVPARPMALHDGWAVQASQTAGATRRKARVLAGPQPLLDAWAVLPDDADAVAPLDHVVMRQQGIGVIRPVRPGQGVVAANEWAHANMLLASAGTRVTFAVAMACAQCGVMDVVVRRPVIDIIFNSPGATRAHDQLMGVVSNAIRGSGSEVGCIQFTAGDRALLADALVTSSADVVTVVGGTGSGPGDTTLKALADVGEVVFHGVRMSPGGTIGFGMVGGKAVFASPGGMADMIAVNIVLTPSFARQAFGRPPLSAPAMRAPLSMGLPAAKHESRLVFAHSAGGSITPFLDEALTPAVLARANASIFIPEGSRHRRRGELVEFRRLGVTM